MDFKSWVQRFCIVELSTNGERLRNGDKALTFLRNYESERGCQSSLKKNYTTVLKYIYTMRTCNITKYI